MAAYVDTGAQVTFLPPIGGLTIYIWGKHVEYILCIWNKFIDSYLLSL